MRPKLSRGDRNADWVEVWCRIPLGPDRGACFVLTEEEREIIKSIYDGTTDAQVTGHLAAYLSLLHLAGPEAVKGGGEPPIMVEMVDSFSLWNAASEDLRTFLRREGDAITCPELATSSKRAA